MVVFIVPPPRIQSQRRCRGSAHSSEYLESTIASQYSCSTFVCVVCVVHFMCLSVL